MELGRRSGELVLHDEGEVCTRAARKARNTQHALQALCPRYQSLHMIVN